MVANRPVPPLSEVFNTYGARRSNASLLAWYGFALDENENDRVGWDFVEVAQALQDSESPSAQLSAQLYKDVLHVWLSTLGSMVADDSRLVFRPDLDDADQRKFTGPSTVLCINSDAQMSEYLWVYLAVCAAFETVDSRRNASVQYSMQETLGSEDTERLVALLGSVMDEQVRLEKALEAETGEGIDVDTDDRLNNKNKKRPHRILSRTADLAIKLCQHRISSIGKHPDLSTAQLGDLFDGVPQGKPKTRLALAQVLAERSILEGCHAGWQELRDTLHED